MSQDRATAITPTAAALVCAVSDRDAREVRDLLVPLSHDDLFALAVVLAGAVPDDTVLTGALSDEGKVFVAIQSAAQAFDTTRERILSTDRRRNVTDARAVAIAALRLVGLTSIYIGEHFNRDHSTVLHAAGRVGENRRLRRIAKEIANEIGNIHVIEEEVA